MLEFDLKDFIYIIGAIVSIVISYASLRQKFDNLNDRVKDLEKLNDYLDKELRNNRDNDLIHKGSYEALKELTNRNNIHVRDSFKDINSKFDEKISNIEKQIYIINNNVNDINKSIHSLQLEIVKKFNVLIKE